MGLAEQVTREMRARREPQAQWPGGSSITAWDTEHGHRDEFSPAEYGNYIATSNDIYSIVTFRARLLSTLTLRAYRGNDQDKVEATRGQIVDLLRKVNPFWTWSRLMRMTEISMGLWGESPWVVNRGANGVGQPREIWWVKPDRMHPVPDGNNYLRGFLYEPIDGGDPIAFKPSEVVWHRYPNPLDEFAGLSPLAAARLDADTSSAMMTSNRKLFTHGLQVGGLMYPKGGGDKVTFTKEQAEELEASLERRLKGADKAHRWSVLRFEAGITQPVSPKDAEFLGGLNVTFKRAARAYGVSTVLLNDTEHATLTNVREYQKALWEHTLVPDAKFYAEELVEQFLPMFRVGRGAPAEPDHLEFDFSSVPALQESATAVWDRERQAIEVGALTINEWRKRHGLPEVPWGNVFWAPVNKAPVAGDEAPEVDPEQQAQAQMQAALATSFDEFERVLKAGFGSMGEQLEVLAVNGHRR